MKKQLLAVIGLVFGSYTSAQSAPITNGELGVVIADSATGIRTIAKLDHCESGANPGLKVEKDQTVKIIARAVCITDRGPANFLVVDKLQYRNILDNTEFEGPAMILESGVVH